MSLPSLRNDIADSLDALAFGRIDLDSSGAMRLFAGADTLRWAEEREPVEDGDADDDLVRT